MWVARRFVSSVIKRGHHVLFQRPRGSLPDLELRYPHCTSCWRSRITVAGFDVLNATLCKDVNKSLDECYTPEQRAIILQRLNSATESELSGVKLLRGQKCVNIVEYRTRHGPFRDLESVINVPRLKHKSAVIVFNSILNPSENDKKNKDLVKFIKPEIDRALLEDADSIVSLVCGLNKIAWAHVTRSLTVLDWREQWCPSFMKGSYQASQYLDDVSAVVAQLPVANYMVVEKPGVSLQNPSLYPVMAHLRTAEAMLFALLAPARRHPPRVLNMTRSVVGRHLGLMVGDTRTSGAQAVREMMMQSATQKGPRVTFTNDLLIQYRNAFRMSGRNEGNELCDALLQAVSFYELLGR